MEKQNENDRPSAGRLINELSRASHIFFQHEFKKYNIGHAQLRTLLFISHHEGLTQMDVAKSMHLDKSSVTSQIQILEKNGYIARKTSPKDARKQVIYITAKTKEILQPIKEVLLTWTDILLEGFTDKERGEVFSFLERMRQNARNKTDKIQKQKV